MDYLHGGVLQNTAGAAFQGDLDLTSDPQQGGQFGVGKVHLRNATIRPLVLPAVRPNDVGPVHVLVPLTGTTLVVDQSFAVQVDINVPYAVDSVTVALDDITSGFRQEWSVKAVANTGSFMLDQVFEVPPDAPTSTDYRLMVTALPVPTNGLQGAQGYSLQVSVAPGP